MRCDWTQELKAYRFPAATLAFFLLGGGFVHCLKRRRQEKNHPAPLWFLSICSLLRDDFLSDATFWSCEFEKVSANESRRSCRYNDIKYMTGGFHYFPAVLLRWFRITLRYVREVTRELINWQYYSSRAANISTLFMLEGDGKRRERTTIRQQLVISKMHRLTMF